MSDEQAKTCPVQFHGNRLVPILLTVIIAVSIAGYFFGMGEAPAHVRVEPKPAVHHGGDVPVAVAYKDLATTERGPNANWTSSFPKAGGTVENLLTGETPTKAQRTAAVAKRKARRAYDGAPPMVPHNIEQQSSRSCLACHDKGISVDGVVAPRMSHKLYPSCTQCHVEMETSGVFITGTHADDVPNSFQGKQSAGEGTRAWPGAPPTIPHTTWMRENCSSCHGELAKPGLRTSHPWRASCTQCHAPSSKLDQVTFKPITGPPVKLK